MSIHSISGRKSSQLENKTKNNLKIKAKPLGQEKFQKARYKITGWFAPQVHGRTDDFRQKLRDEKKVTDMVATLCHFVISPGDMAR